MKKTGTDRKMLVAGLLVWAFVAGLGTSGALAAVETKHAGTVVAVDQAAASIVIEEVGPLLKTGKSEIRRVKVQVGSSAEFTLARRIAGAGPDGWIGAYVETPLPAWQVKDGDFAVVAVDKGKAVKVTVVDTREP